MYQSTKAKHKKLHSLTWYLFNISSLSRKETKVLNKLPITGKQQGEYMILPNRTISWIILITSVYKFT